MVPVYSLYANGQVTSALRYLPYVYTTYFVDRCRTWYSCAFYFGRVFTLNKLRVSLHREMTTQVNLTLTSGIGNYSTSTTALFNSHHIRNAHRPRPRYFTRHRIRSPPRVTYDGHARSARRAGPAAARHVPFASIHQSLQHLRRGSADVWHGAD